LLLGGFSWVIKGQSETSKANVEMKYELLSQAAATKAEVMNKIDKLETRMTNVEGNRNTLTTTAFFQWAVHLQQSNPQMKVPEPEVSTK